MKTNQVSEELSQQLRSPLQIFPQILWITASVSWIEVLGFVHRRGCAPGTSINHGQLDITGPLYWRLELDVVSGQGQGEVHFLEFLAALR